ncbi:Qat anti-phage system associated protein QatB [Leptolyngbya iicbica]|uniref:Qat anti-phage system associated protein QatB n=1 Tax=Leptolyngbya iicbica TaxID=3161580 RepID=UPI00267501B9|nr:Qat anti-phage system associated protein QatB [Leptolyngbya sp. LK]
MGTSKSYDGPKDRTPLLPPWAFPDTGNGAEPSPESPDSSLPNQPAEEQPSEKPPVDQPSPSTEPPQAIPGNSWRSAKISLGKTVTGGRSRASLAGSGRKYVGALGGARRASNTSRAGRASTARLGQFLSSVGSRGLNETLQSFGLSSFIGKDSESIFTAISNALAPAGASREEAIARRAVNEALEVLYEQVLLADGDLTKLDQMGTQEIAQALQASVSSYIYQRWLAELEVVLEKKAISANQAVRYERDMRVYIQECVELDMQGIDVLNMDWNGQAGQQFIDKIFTEAYRILEDSQ